MEFFLTKQKPHYLLEQNGTNYHRPVNSGGCLITSCSTTGVSPTYQQLYFTYLGEIFMRGYHDNAWTDWNQVIHTSNLRDNALTLFNTPMLANGTNVNSVTTYGCYGIESIQSAESMSNLPIATAGTLFVKNAMGGANNYIQQIFVPYTADAIYIRMSNNYGSSWFTWRVIGQEDGWWNITIPRATFTTLANNRWHRQGNIVFCETCISITASETGNAYIGSDCIPKFGLTLGNVQGVWHDYNADKSGTIAGYNGGNIWMALNGNSPAPLTNFVGHAIGITLTAMLH